MKNIWALDIETDKFEAVHEKPIKFRFAVIKSETETMIFKNKIEFDEFLLSIAKRNNGRNKNTIIYAHNLMFDFSYCILPFLRQGFVIRPLENGGKLISVKIGKYRVKNRKDKQGNTKEVREFDTYLEFRDSYSLFQCSLKKLGQFVGLEKIEHDKEFSDEPNQQDIEYCIRDCEIVLLALQKIAEFHERIFETSTDIAQLPATTAAFAFKVFKHKNSSYSSEKEKIVCPWICSDENLNNLFLENYYFGGRVELFNADFVENVHYYDINSLYPHVMIKYAFHAPPYRIRDFESSDLVNQKTVGFFAKIDESKERIPLLPVRFNHGLYFPATVKETFIFKEEFDYLRERKIPMKLVRVLVSKNNPVNPFQYLKEFYNLKKAGGAISYFYKILMNATYGRFGIDQEKEVFELKSEDLVNYRLENAEPLGGALEGYCKIREQKTLQFERNLILAAKITALARLELTKTIHKLSENNIKIYYCDTDSIVCQENSILQQGTELGQFKKEHSFLWFAGLGNKEYAAKLTDGNYLVKLKGVHNADLEALFDYHSELGVQQLNVSKLKTMINKSVLDNPVNLVSLKRCKTIYHKRRLGLNCPIVSFDHLRAIELENADIIAKTIARIKEELKNEAE